MMSKDLWMFTSHYNTTYILETLDTHIIPPVALNAVSGVMAIFGLLGNVLVFFMTRHPALKDNSYRVHFAFLAVVDTLDLASTLSDIVADTYIYRDALFASSVPLCKIGRALQQWVGDMAVMGLLGLVLDRYVALVQRRFKKLICTCTNARLMCSLNMIITFVISITCSSTFFVMTFPGLKICVEDSASVHFFYLASASTGVVPGTFILLFATHTATVLLRRRPLETTGSAEGEGSSDRQTGGTILALSFVCILTYLPKAVYEIVHKYLFIQHLDLDYFKRSSQAERSKLFGITDLISLVSCVNLSCKVYVLLTSRFFRRCCLETLPLMTLSLRRQPTDMVRPPRRLATLAVTAMAGRVPDEALGSSAVNSGRAIHTDISLEPSSCQTDLETDGVSDNAHSCNGIHGDGDRNKEVKVIAGGMFRGKALSEDREPIRAPGPGLPVSDPSTTAYPFFTRLYTVRVDDVFAMPEWLKGNATIIIKTHSSSATCGARFTLRKSAVFAAYSYNGEVRTSLCMPNVYWKNVQRKHRRLLKSGRISKKCALKKEVIPTLS